MQLRSSKFENARVIPTKYSCIGEDISPPLEWEEVPAGTKTIVLICEDPDAPHGTWDHWVVYNIPPSVRELPENIAKLPAGAVAGVNSSGKAGYVGPCPPKNEEHRYFFSLYALNKNLTFSTLPKKANVEADMRDGILAKAILMGKFKNEPR